jgi:hypothetical protein
VVQDNSLVGRSAITNTKTLLDTISLTDVLNFNVVSAGIGPSVRIIHGIELY